MSIRCLVIGTGKMGQVHLQVLAALAPENLVGWAPSPRYRTAVEALGVRFESEDLDGLLEQLSPTHVIIATPVETLASIAMQVMHAGVKHVLLEKPAALDWVEGTLLQQCAKTCGATVHVGYNRRFYTSVRMALERIRAANESIDSILFEFNEVVSTPKGPSGHAPEVQARWLLANSLHVIDVAFHPVGLPDMQRSHFQQSGSLVWHQSGSRFVGSGETVTGVPFACHANWNAPGRWGFEWMTPSTRYVFRPLEKLAIMRHGHFDLELVELQDTLDVQYKPGVYRQNQAFLAGDTAAGLVPLSEALSLIPLGQQIAGYPCT